MTRAWGKRSASASHKVWVSTSPQNRNCVSCGRVSMQKSRDCTHSSAKEGVETQKVRADSFKEENSSVGSSTIRLSIEKRVIPRHSPA